MSARRPLFALALALVAASAASAACGLGHSEGVPPGDGGSGGSSGSSGGGSGGSSGGALACPASSPASGASCALPAGTQCEYAYDVDPQCSTIATCTAGRTWSFGPTGRPPPACPTPKASGACPATYAAGRAGDACTDNGLECGYPEGRCYCGPSAGGPVQIDGGARWQCDVPAVGCPSPRPALGSSCGDAPGVTCGYGGCTLPGGLTEACQNGIWVEVTTPCPL